MAAGSPSTVIAVSYRAACARTSELPALASCPPWSWVLASVLTCGETKKRTKAAIIRFSSYVFFLAENVENDNKNVCGI